MGLKKLFTIGLITTVLALGFEALRHPPISEAQSGSCNLTVAISVAASNTQNIATAVPGATVRVCAYSLSADTIATTGQFASNSTNLTGAMRFCDECNASVGDGTGILLEGLPGGTLTLAATTGAITGWVRIGQ